MTKQPKDKKRKNTLIFRKKNFELWKKNQTFPEFPFNTDLSSKPFCIFRAVVSVGSVGSMEVTDFLREVKGTHSGTHENFREQRLRTHRLKFLTAAMHLSVHNGP